MQKEIIEALKELVHHLTDSKMYELLGAYAPDSAKTWIATSNGTTKQVVIQVASNLSPSNLLDLWRIATQFAYDNGASFGQLPRPTLPKHLSAWSIRTVKQESESGEKEQVKSETTHSSRVSPRERKWTGKYILFQLQRHKP
jgi:hypothetical protein